MGRRSADCLPRLHGVLVREEARLLTLMAERCKSPKHEQIFVFVSELYADWRVHATASPEPFGRSLTGSALFVTRVTFIRTNDFLLKHVTDIRWAKRKDGDTNGDHNGEDEVLERFWRSG